MWQMYRRLEGSADSSSESMRPVTLTVGMERYMATTPSRAPDWHSTIKDARSVALGVTISAICEMDAHASWALGGGVSTLSSGRERADLQLGAGDGEHLGFRGAHLGRVGVDCEYGKIRERD